MPILEEMPQERDLLDELEHAERELLEDVGFDSDGSTVETTSETRVKFAFSALSSKFRDLSVVECSCTSTMELYVLY